MLQVLQLQASPMIRVLEEVDQVKSERTQKKDIEVDRFAPHHVATAITIAQDRHNSKVGALPMDNTSQGRDQRMLPLR
jgi:hypothetical protein